MDILFYLEPAIEHNNPLFRFSTLRNSLAPQAKVFEKDRTILLCNRQIAEKAIIDNYKDNFSQLAVVDPVEWSHGESAYDRLMRLQSQEYKPDEINRITNILKKILPSDFIPDIIISWESPAHFFKKIFPSTKIIYQTPGFFSRPPYPNLISMEDALLKIEDNQNSPPRQETSTPDQNNIEFENDLSLIRKLDADFLNTVSPINNLIHLAYSKFSRIILLPLQVDNYFMVNDPLKSAGYSNQLELIIDLLNKTPTSIGVWVTNYKSKDIQSQTLSNDVICSLRKNYSNFIYFDECNEVPCVSQYLVPKLDGVIAISSSVGFQTAYYQKPLFCIGDSHISKFTTSNTYEAFIQDVNTQKLINQDERISYTIMHHHFPIEFMTSKKFRGWVVRFIETNQFQPWTNTPQQALSALRRESLVLNDGNIQKNSPSFDYCPELLSEISKHDVISFDIFDTLLVRPLEKPTDLFKLANKYAQAIVGSKSFDFFLVRTAAEKKAFQLALDAGNEETTIEEIYQVISHDTHISSHICKQLMNLEMQLEKRLLYRRETAYTAFEEAKRQGKKIIIVSDMYLPTSFLESVLEKNHYTGYHKIYVSSQYKVKKHSGKLFDLVLNDFQDIPVSKILHIGDNIRGDVENPQKKGVHTFHLPKPFETFMQHDDYKRPWLRDETNHNLDWRCILSVIGQRLNDNSYLPYRKGTLFGGDPWRLGFYGFGPLLLGFVKWLIENAIAHRVDTLYFLSRDGKIMKDAYDTISHLYPSAPKSVYLLCSRRAVNIAKIKNFEDILDLLYVDFAHNMTLGNLLQDRFGIKYDDIDHSILDKHGFSWSGNNKSRISKKDLPRLRLLFEDLQDIILKISKNERESYLSYLEEVDIFNPDKNNAIVDIGYAGTMQESLFLLSNKSKKLSGYYLITFRKALERLKENGIESFAYLANFIDRHDTYHPFCKYVPLYETLFSSNEASFVKMIKNWNGLLCPIFMDINPEEHARNLLVQKCHSGALEFIKHLTGIFGSTFKHLDIEPNKSLRVLDLFFRNPHPRDARIFSGICFEDAYGGRGKVFILPTDANLSSGGIWREGCQIINADLSRSQSTNTNETLNTTQKIVSLCLSPFLNDRKKRKFIHNPKLFFFDSQSKIVKYLGALYFRNNNHD